MPLFNANRSTLLATLTVALLVMFASPAAALTQHDWMVALVDSLGRSFGLPDKPGTDDYLNILLGKRNLRLEAETIRSDEDEVNTLAFLNYGPFSGTGWLLGTSRPTDVHLRFVLPLDGRYRLSITARLPGHVVKAGDRVFPVDADKQKFSRTDVGDVALTAGPQEIIVTLPPGGALDCIELTAPNLPPIAPAAGWQPEAPLTWEALALTVVEALGLQKDLPAGNQVMTLEAESLADTDGARVVEDAHLGRPSGGRWLRTSARPARIAVPLTVAQSGFYQLELTAMGSPVEVLVNDHLILTADGKPYLSLLPFPPVFLHQGDNHLEVSLPPGGGLDRITVTARQSDLTTLAATAGMTATAAPPTSADLDHLTVRLSAAAR